MRRGKVAVLIISALVINSLLPRVSVYGEEKPILIEAETIDSEDTEEADGYHALSYEVDTIGSVQLQTTIPQPTGSPATYDPRSNNYITDVKNQGSYGVCWAFAAINSAETDAIMDGRSVLAETDLSEAQLAYFFYHRLADPKGGTAGDEVICKRDNYLLVGGNNQLSTFSLASWISPANESVMPYENVSTYSTANVTSDMAYASNVAHLQNAYWISIEDRAIVKELIMQYGAATVSYYNDSSYYQYKEDGCYYYYPFEESQNHAVSVVGWDDTIPKETFSVKLTNGITYTPSVDGAWLIKNSYGSNWGDDGYFWLSYEDGGLRSNSNLAIAFDFESAQNYDNNYQYDGGVGLSRLFYEDLTTCYNANVFTAQSEESLKAVGFYTTQPGMEYEIQVYRNLSGDSPLGTAALQTTVTGTANYAGYHTVALPTGIELKAGETFSVVVRYKTDLAGISFLLDRSYDYGWVNSISANTSGQSYYSVDGLNWHDSSDDYESNIRIKAFTDCIEDDTEEGNGNNGGDSTEEGNGNNGGDSTEEGNGGDGENSTEEDKQDPPVDIATTGVTLNKTTYSLEKGDTFTLVVTVFPTNATNKEVKWSSSNSTVVDVSSTGVITAKKAGTAKITVTTMNGGYTAACQVKVTDPTPTSTITGLSLSATYVPLREQRKLNLTIKPANASWTELQFSSSNSKIATISSDGIITGIAPGKTTITVRTNDNRIVATTTITVYNQTESFVARLYNKCLGREEEAAGLNYWNQVLVGKQKSGAQVAYGFVFSEEYENSKSTNEEYVEMLYQVFMNRSADSAGKAYWVDLLNQGVSREYVFCGFAHSQEYTNICNSYGIVRGNVTLTQPRDKNVNLTKFVNRIYVKAMGRSGEADGINYWCSIIQSKNMTPEQVAEWFINSTEFKNKNLNNEEYIKVLYRTFFGREYDKAGLEYWLGRMNQGCTREEVLRYFARSQEFKNIMATFGL